MCPLYLLVRYHPNDLVFFYKKNLTRAEVDSKKDYENEYCFNLTREMYGLPLRRKWVWLNPLIILTI